MRRAWIGERGVMDHWKKPSIKCYITIHYIRYHDYDYCLFIYIAIWICFGFVYMLFKFRSFRGVSISSHGLLLSVNGSSLIQVSLYLFQAISQCTTPEMERWTRPTVS